MSSAFFFGYGSLVNARTHGYGNVHSASVHGWRRAWRHTSVREVSFLTCVPDAQSRIHGVVAAVPDGNWTELDAREHAYDRRDVTSEVTHSLGRAATISLYAIAPERHGAPSDEHPILMSYLETVLQGYLRRYGTAGVRDFIATTDGWEAPIRDDRAACAYPRHQPISRHERELFGDLLSDAGARIHLAPG